MTEMTRLLPPAEVLANPTDEDFADMYRLVSQLSSKTRDPETVAANVRRAVGSPTATLLVARDFNEGRIQGAATLNLAPTHRGVDPWIDDVVTDRSVRKQGWSKPLMSEAERLAGQVSDHVSLTSSATREEARAGYTKRGYQLMPNEIYRNEAISQSSRPDRVELLFDELGERDLVGIATLLGQDPEVTQKNVEAVLESPVDGLLAVRDVQGAISGIATASLCTIPVGYKAWVRVDAQTESDSAALMTGAEYWASPVASSLNTIFTPPAEAGGYDRRDSGLYVLPLGGPAVGATVLV